MALNYLNKELKGPVTKPTGHEPMTTHVNKLLSGAMNYHGMPVPVDTRPTFSGAAGGPRAMVTKPTDHKPSFLSNIPLPFHTVVYNANARHVPDIETVGTEAARRRAEIRMQAARDAYVPVGAPIALLHQGNIASLQSRLVEKRNALRRSGLSPPEVDALVADDVREIRAATIAMEEAQGGFGPARLRAERVLAPHMPEDMHKMRAEEYKTHLEKPIIDPSDPTKRTVLDPFQVSELMRLYNAPHSATDESELSARINTGMAAAPVSAYMKLSTRDWMDKFHPLAPKSVLSGPLNGPTATSGAFVAPAAHVPGMGIGIVAGATAAAAVAGGGAHAGIKRGRPQPSLKLGIGPGFVQEPEAAVRELDFGASPGRGPKPAIAGRRVGPASKIPSLTQVLANWRRAGAGAGAGAGAEASAQALSPDAMMSLPTPDAGSVAVGAVDPRLVRAAEPIESVTSNAGEQAIGEARGNFVKIPTSTPGGAGAGAGVAASAAGKAYAGPPGLEYIEFPALSSVSPAKLNSTRADTMKRDFKRHNHNEEFDYAPKDVKALWSARYTKAWLAWLPQTPGTRKRVGFMQPAKPTRR